MNEKIIKGDADIQALLKAFPKTIQRYTNIIENISKKEIFDSIEKEVLLKIRIDEDRHYFWKEIFNPLKRKHLIYK